MNEQIKEISEMQYLDALGNSYVQMAELDPELALESLREGLRMSDASKEDVSRFLLNLEVEL